MTIVLVLRRCASLLLAAALALTACDTDVSQDDDREPDPGVVRTGLAALYAGDDPTPDELAESECFADALLERLDPDELVVENIVQDSGEVAPVLPMLDVDTAEVWVDAQADCIDFVEVSTRALGAQSKGRIDAEAYAACLRSALTEDEIHAALVRTLSGGFDSPEVDALSTAQADCARSASPPE